MDYQLERRSLFNGPRNLNKRPATERFERLVMPVTESGCWIWIGHLNHGGYGVAYEVGRKSVGAHRLSWVIHRGDIPAGLHVLHRCDVRACVNPDHLFLGTNADNVKDRVAKGRSTNPGRRRDPNDIISLGRAARTVGLTVEQLLRLAKSGEPVRAETK